MVACSLHCPLWPPQTQFPPFFHPDLTHFSLYGGGREDIFPIQQSCLPSYFFPQGISCQDAHSHPIILVVQLQYIFVTQQFRPQFRSTQPFYASSHSPSSILSHSFRFLTGIKLQNISIHFFFWARKLNILGNLSDIVRRLYSFWIAKLPWQCLAVLEAFHHRSKP